MQVEAGRNRVLVVGLLIMLSTGCQASGYRVECLGGGYVMTYVTPTIQTIGRYVHIEDEGKHRIMRRILRGRIEFMAVTTALIGGYLSTRYFDEDELTAFAGEFDKEGFFVVDRVEEKVVSGLAGDEFFDHLRSEYSRKEVEFSTPEDIRGIGVCDE